MNNMVEIVGVIGCESRFNNEIGDCKFYQTEIRSCRESGIEDVLPCIVAEALISECIVGETVYIQGNFRSFNDKANRRVQLYIYAEQIELVDASHMNAIHLCGIICKEPILRQTPRGRKICDLIVAAHRTCGQSDYIPCVLWGHNAERGARLMVGQQITLDGRIQSRQYQKQLADRMETRVAYEVSVTHFSVD